MQTQFPWNSGHAEDTAATVMAVNWPDEMVRAARKAAGNHLEQLLSFLEASSNGKRPPLSSQGLAYIFWDLANLYFRYLEAGAASGEYPRVADMDHVEFNLSDPYRKLLAEASVEKVLGVFGSLLDLVAKAVRRSGRPGPEQQRALAALESYGEGVRGILREDWFARLAGDRDGHGAASGEMRASAGMLEKFYLSLFRSSDNPVLLLDKDWRVRAVNARAVSLLGRSQKELHGADIRTMLPDKDAGRLESVMGDLGQGQVWKHQVSFARPEGGGVRAEVAVDRVDTQEGAFYHLVARDLSREGELAGELHDSKTRVEDMSTTLKNVIQTLESEKKEFKSGVAHQFQVEVLPVLDRMVQEPEEEVRRTCRDVIQEQLAALTRGETRGNDVDLFRLTPTEIEVCRYIQSGRGTKEVADLRNTSFDTIQTHRKNIRRKLGLKGRKVSLYSFLKSRDLRLEEPS